MVFKYCLWVLECAFKISCVIGGIIFLPKTILRSTYFSADHTPQPTPTTKSLGQ